MFWMKMAASIADAFHHRDGTGIAHGETLTGDAGEVAFAADGAIQHGVADNDGGRGFNVGIGMRLDDDSTPRQAFADIVIAIAGQGE